MVQNHLVTSDIHDDSGQLNDPWSMFKEKIYYQDKPNIVKTSQADMLDKSHNVLLGVYLNRGKD